MTVLRSLNKSYNKVSETLKILSIWEFKHYLLRKNRDLLTY